MTIETIAQAAARYDARGWKPVPVNRKSKKPIGAALSIRPYSTAMRRTSPFSSAKYRRD
jgi:hypothetical protein